MALRVAALIDYLATGPRSRPTMREAIARAELGDNGYGEDPTVNRLEQMAAAMIAKEAAMLVPSGTMANIVALLTHCARGTKG